VCALALTLLQAQQHWKVEGEIAGQKIEFRFYPPSRPDITVRYIGNIETPTLMRGTMASQRKW
jgi:hypothetical protein